RRVGRSLVDRDRAERALRRTGLGDLLRKLEPNLIGVVDVRRYLDLRADVLPRRRRAKAAEASEPTERAERTGRLATLPTGEAREPREAPEAADVRLERDVLADRNRRLHVVGRENVRRSENVRVAVFGDRVQEDAKGRQRDPRAEEVLRARQV